MDIRFNHNPWGRKFLGGLWDTCCHLAFFIFVEVDVTLAIAKSVFGLVEWHPNVGTDGRQSNSSRRLQNKWFNIEGAG